MIFSSNKMFDMRTTVFLMNKLYRCTTFVASCYSFCATKLLFFSYRLI